MSGELTDARHPLRRALRRWGTDAQEWMLIEEVGELLSALGKIRRGRCTPEELASEIADVRITLKTIAHVWAVEDEAERQERIKLARLVDSLSVAPEEPADD